MRILSLIALHLHLAGGATNGSVLSSMSLFKRRTSRSEDVVSEDVVSEEVIDVSSITTTTILLHNHPEIT